MWDVTFTYWFRVLISEAVSSLAAIDTLEGRLSIKVSSLKSRLDNAKKS
jgi:hypothetical protein